MKKIYTKIISIFVSCVVLLGLFSFGASALEGTGTEADPIIVSDYAALRSLMANAPTDGTTIYIKLGTDILSDDIQNDYSLTLTKKDQNVVLDLAGHSITRSSDITVDKGVIRANDGVLTIKDSVGGGAVVAKGRIESAVAMYSTGVLGKDNGAINIHGGTYYSESYNNIAVYNECGDLYIFGGTFKATGHGYGIFAAAGLTVIYGGTFCATDDEDSRAVYLGTDQYILLYNLTAFGMVDSNSIENDIWQYLDLTGRIFIDGSELTDKSKTDELVGNVIEFKTVITEKLEIFVDEPGAGKQITKNAWVPMGVTYEIVKENGENVIAWFEGDAFADGTFEKAKVYRVRVYVQVDLPVMQNLTAEVNGKKAILELKKEDKDYQYRRYWVEYTFPAVEDPVLKNLDITIAPPIGGEVINGGSIYSTEKFQVLADWHSAPSEILGKTYGNLNGKYAPSGTTCYATVFINANDIYKFSSDTTVVINGKQIEFEWFASEHYPRYIMVQNLPFEIHGEQTGYILGDVDNDGDVDADDYIILKRVYFGVTKLENLENPKTAKMRCDIDKDGEISADDYIFLKRAYFGALKI